MEELGWDRDERSYFVLDDNRLYRRTEPPLPPAATAKPKAKPKASTKKAQAARRRASKRRRVEEIESPEPEEHEEEQPQPEEDNGGASSTEVDTYGGFKWECLAITLTEYQEFCESLRKSKDPNEKNLRQSVIDNVLPIIEGLEEKQRRKIEKRQRELQVLEKLATAKRSSRLADKHDRERSEREAAEAQRKRAADLAAARKEQERQEKMDTERQSRMMTREQRIKDREFKRLLKEEELARDAEEARRIEEGNGRGSERQLKERIEKNKKELEDLNAEEDWTFDCSGCGAYGKNLVCLFFHAV